MDPKQANAKKDAKEVDVPDSFLCPLTQEVLRDPVVDPDGNSYERHAIEAWLEKNSTSPITRKPLRREELVPNRALRDVIAEHYKSKGLAPPQPLPAKKAEIPQIGNVAVKITSRPTGNAPNEFDVLISVQPPAGNKRTPCDICCVVDVSGSMASEAKLKNEQGGVESHGLSLLDVVKHSVKTVVTCMHPDDRIAVVAYSDAAKTVFPLAKMDAANKDKVLAALDTLQANGSTNLWDGLHKGLELLRPEATPGRLSSLLLLTDGLPNISPPRGEVPMLQRYIDQNRQLSCVISTFGFGYEINSELLRDVANVGGGMYAFIPDASFVGTAFVNAVSNLLTTMARDVVIAIEPQNGAKLAEKNSGMFGMHMCQPASWGASVNLRSMQYGQSRDLVFRLVNVPVEGSYVTVSVQHDLGSSEQPHKITADGVDRSGGAEITAQRIRLLFVEKCHQATACAHKEDVNGAKSVVNGFIEEIVKSDAANNDAIKGLLTDLTGQVTEAVSRVDYYKKWGKHYVPSLMRAHQLQQCNNFKDPGVQFYGGVLFKSERDTADEIFCKLPVPKPSVRRPAAPLASSGSANAAPAPSRAISSMRVYHNRSAPCDINMAGFAGSSLARMADGSERPVSALRKGDKVYTPECASPAEIVCVIKTLCPTGSTSLVKLSENLLITPYHPVRRQGKWSFPCNLAEAKQMPCEAVFSFVLADHHVMLIGGEECVSLGHSFNESSVIAHPYFGSKRIVNDLANMAGWESGLVVFAAPAMVRDESGLVSGFATDVVGA